ncbi:MAG TPA: exodeoxyribonuclease VII small subunit [Methylophilaceae bacterium]
MTKTTAPKNFEAALADLEAIVSQMENNQLPLEQSLDAYKRGAELLRFCQQALQDAEQKVRLLNEQNTLQNFADD